MPISAEKINNYLQTATETIILLIIGLIPVYFAFLYKDLSVFELDKVVIFRLLVEVLSLLYVIKILILKKIEIKFSKWQMVLPAFFLLAWIIATIFSYSPYVSFWGHYLRQQGLFTYLHYFIFFFIVWQNFDINERKTRLKFLLTILISSSIVCLYGLIQYFGLDPIKWQEENLLFRINSTIGQPNCLGLYLLLVIPLAVYSIIFFKKIFSKIIITLVLVLQLAVLILTYSRSAWLGFMLIFFAGLFFFLFKYKYKRILYACLFLSFLLGLILPLIILRHNTKVDSTYDFSLKGRTVSTFAIYSGSNMNRIMNYKTAMAAIRQKILIGYGPETMWLWYDKYYDKNILYYEPINNYFDRTHNEILDVFIFTGIIGGIGYLILLGYILCIAIKDNIKLLNKEHEDYLPFFLFLALVAYFIGVQFSFSITATNVYFWLYAALMFVLVNKHGNRQNMAIPFEIRKAIKIFVVILFSAAVIYMAWQLNINKIIADHYFYKALSGITSHNSISEVNEHFLKSLEFNPQEDYYRIRFADKAVNLFEKAVPCEEKIKALEPISNMLGSMPRERRDFNAEISLLKSRSYTEKCENKLDIKKLDKDVRNLENYAPDNINIIIGMANLYYSINENERAMKEIKTAMNKLPDLNDKRLNEQKILLIKNQLTILNKSMGDINFDLKEYKDSLIYYQKALELDGYTNFDLRNKITDILIRQGNIEPALKIDLHSYVLSGQNKEYCEKLNKTYKEKYQKDIPKNCLNF